MQQKIVILQKNGVFWRFGAKTPASRRGNGGILHEALLSQTGVARVLRPLLQKLGHALRARSRVRIELLERIVRRGVVGVDGDEVFQRRRRASGIAGADIGIGGVDGGGAIRGVKLKRLEVVRAGFLVVARRVGLLSEFDIVSGFLLM